MGRTPPHPALGRRRRIEPAQRLPTLPTPPHPDPPRRLADHPRTRPAPPDHPAHHPRPGTTPPTQHPAPTTHLRLAKSRVIRLSRQTMRDRNNARRPPRPPASTDSAPARTASTDSAPARTASTDSAPARTA